MRTLTKQELISVVAGRWYEHYCKNANFSNEWPGKFEFIYKQLVALKNPTEEQVTKIIGNDSWTRITCELCKQSVDKVVIENVNDHPVYMCEKCLILALQLLRNLDK